MFAYCITAQAAILIKEVDVNGDWVRAAYSYVHSDGSEHCSPFMRYALCYDAEAEDSFFEYAGERFYLNEFHNAYGYDPSET
jgi:hypothetical protein